MIRGRKAVYCLEGRSEKWRKMKRITENLLRKCQAAHLQSQRYVLLVDDAKRNFFCRVEAFQSCERPHQFNPKLLFPGKSDLEMAEGLANYFNCISQELIHSIQKMGLVPMNPGCLPWPPTRCFQETKVDGDWSYFSGSHAQVCFPAGNSSVRHLQ